MKNLKEQIAELEKLDAERTQGDIRIETFAIAAPKEASLGIFKEGKYVRRLSSDMPIEDARYFANAPKMMQVIRELVKQSEEKDRLLGVCERALKHYAEVSEWHSSVHSPWRLIFNSSDFDGDGYAIAQKALTELKAIGGDDAR